MSGFEELVERARRELAEAGTGQRSGPGAPTRLQAQLDSQARFRAELARLLETIDGHARPFDLRSDGATTPLRRWLARALAGLLNVGGLGKHLGANQLRANQAALGALRLLAARLLEQERALAESAAALDPRDRSARRDGAQE